MSRWVIVFLISMALHSLCFLYRFNLPLIVTLQHSVQPSVHVTWVQHLQDVVLEPSHHDNPLKDAQLLTEDLLKESLEMS